MARAHRIAAAAALLLLAGACHRPPADPAHRPNVIVLLADTLRADRVGGASGAPSLTPFLDSLAAEGTTFTRASAASSWTNPSVASLFTSRYPGQHGQNHIGTILSDRDPLLAERLAALDYASAAISAQVLLSPGLGLSRGFGTVRIVQSPKHQFAPGTAAEVNAAALQWLDQRAEADRARPFFLYLHYMDTHLPFVTPPEFLEPILLRQADPGIARALAQRAAQRLDEILREMRDPGFDPSREQKTVRRLGDVVAGLAYLYDAEVSYLDAQLRALFDALRARELLNDCVVVFTADHGEEFFEHGQFGHGRTLYDEVMRVPLLFWDGQRHPAARVETPVSLVDVAPTLLEIVGGPIPPAFMGHSALATAHAAGGLTRRLGQLATRGEGAEAAAIFAELYPNEAFRRPDGSDAPTRAVATAEWKLIADPPGPKERLFHLTDDPGERHPADDPAARAAPQAALRAFVAASHADPPAATPVALDDATRQRLRALGYAPR